MDCSAGHAAVSCAVSPAHDTRHPFRSAMVSLSSALCSMTTCKEQDKPHKNHNITAPEASLDLRSPHELDTDLHLARVCDCEVLWRCVALHSVLGVDGRQHTDPTVDLVRLDEGCAGLVPACTRYHSCTQTHSGLCTHVETKYCTPPTLPLCLPRCASSHSIPTHSAAAHT